MKTILKRIMPFILSVEILVASFFTCSVSVYAADFMPHDIVEAVEYGIEYNDWDPFWRFLYEVPNGLMYLYSQMGAFTTKDFCKWVDNNKKLESLVNTVPVKKEDENIIFTKEFMTQLKALLDEYAKEEQTKEENGGFYLFPTTNISDVPVGEFINSQQMRTFRNIVIEKGVLPVRVKYKNAIRFVDPFSDPDHPILLVGDLSNLNRLETYPYMPVGSHFFCANCWEKHYSRVQVFPEDDKIYTSVSDGIDYETASTLDLSQVWAYTNFDFENHGSVSANFTLYSATGERVRVFVSQNAAKNYSVGNRKVYFTENYYNYVPEDLTVSIDDLQKSVDDLQKVIDGLLKQIGDDTSEKEIEDLLRQILEELRNQQGGSGGSGGSGPADKAWYDKVLDYLDKILKQLKSIKHWTIADTVVDAADAVADWADLILGILKDAKAGAGAAVSAIASGVGDTVGLMAKKFPFSIPWDILFFVSVLSAEPQMPHFEIPFNIELSALDITVDYTMELDFSQLQWLSDLSRLLLSMTYAVGLMKMTFGVTSIGKEE